MKELMGFLLIALGGYGATAQATPWGMAKDADIKTVDGVVSICIPASDADDVPIDSVWLTESNLNNGARQTMWDIEKVAGSAPIGLKPGECLKYGAELPGYNVNVSEQELKAGVTYRVRLNIFIKNPKHTSTLFYTAVFCPVVRDGKVIYLPYRYEPDGRVLKPRCDE
ncbi:hypothetical protein [Pseudomonas citronellolis]|uniref:hypothetical protein n=1 Tax=Pseudomonas citronellolis TaxID=53408 RepID=UPI0023E36948|nr:hypothetical protein [Pseudomonas citronellolis]MDF3931927.1 hypothetical protein [Pseudomonas citronellolis]